MTQSKQTLSEFTHYDKSSNSWVNVLFERENKIMVKSKENICKFVSRDNLMTYDEYMADFIKTSNTVI